MYILYILSLFSKYFHKIPGSIKSFNTFTNIPGYLSEPLGFLGNYLLDSWTFKG